MSSLQADTSVLILTQELKNLMHLGKLTNILEIPTNLNLTHFWKDILPVSSTGMRAHPLWDMRLPKGFVWNGCG